MIDIWLAYRACVTCVSPRGGSRTAETSKMERFATHSGFGDKLLALFLKKHITRSQTTIMSSVFSQKKRNAMNSR